MSTFTRKIGRTWTTQIATAFLATVIAGAVDFGGVRTWFTALIAGSTRSQVQQVASEIWLNSGDTVRAVMEGDATQVFWHGVWTLMQAFGA